LSPSEIYDAFREYEQDFRDTFGSEVDIDERFLIEGAEGVSHRSQVSLCKVHRIKASFEVQDSEIEGEIEQYVSQHFKGFLRHQLGCNLINL